MNAGTIGVVVVLLAIIAFACKDSLKHFKGEGGCCGGSSEKPEKKKLSGEKMGEKIIHIEGMHCKNCKNSVEKHINEIDGAVAKVNLKKKIAIVSLDREVSEEQLWEAVEKADFTVTGIESR